MSKVFVVGSINMDLVSTAPKHPKVGETVLGDDFQTIPGGKGANQAIAAAKAGIETHMIGRVGDDDFGLPLANFLASQGVDTNEVQPVPGQPTGTATITVANAENTIVIVPGANFALRPDDVSRLPIEKDDVVLAQFETPLETIAALFVSAVAKGAKTILNPSPYQAIPEEILKSCDYLIVNRLELDQTGKQPSEIIDQYQMKAVIVTHGPDGVTAYVKDEELPVAGHRVTAVDSTGAGDCFAGAFAAELARGRPLREAVEFANAAAALSVQTPGAGPSMPGRKQVEEFLNA